MTEITLRYEQFLCYLDNADGTQWIAENPDGSGQWLSFPRGQAAVALRKREDGSCTFHETKPNVVASVHTYMVVPHPQPDERVWGLFTSRPTPNYYLVGLIDMADYPTPADAFEATIVSQLDKGRRRLLRAILADDPPEV